MEFGCGEGGGSSHNRWSDRDPQARWALLVQISSALSRVQFPRAPRKGVDALEFGCRESGGGARGVTYHSGSRWIGGGRSTLPPRRLPHSYCRHGSYGGGRVSGEALASTARRRRGKDLRGPRWRPRRRGGMERLSAAVDEYALSLGADRILGGLAMTYQLSSLGMYI